MLHVLTMLIIIVTGGSFRKWWIAYSLEGGADLTGELIPKCSELHSMGTASDMSVIPQQGRVF